MKRIELVPLAGLLLCLGCGENWQADTYPAQGRITVNGEAPEGAVIELYATGEAVDVRNSRPWAIVGADGTYALSTYERGDGAPPGQYAVTIRWPPDVSQPSLADRLGGAFVRPEQSRWSVTVSEGDNELPPIEISGAKVSSKEQTNAPRRAPPGPAMGN